MDELLKKLFLLWPTGSQENITAAYEAMIAKCDDGYEPSLSGIVWATGLLMLSLAGICLQIFILPANWRLGRQRTAYRILLHINCIDTFLLSQFVWIAVELLVGKRAKIPFDFASVFQKTINQAQAHMQIVLALNRTLAIFAPIYYGNVFNARKIWISLSIAWLSATVWGIWNDWVPELRGFHCLSTRLFGAADGLIRPRFYPESFDFVMKIFYIRLFLPNVLYLFCVVKLCYEKYCGNTNFVQIIPRTQQQIQTYTTDALAERTRLFFICFVGTLPVVVIYVANVNLISYTDFFNAYFMYIYALVYIQQPLLMLALSRDFRAEMKRELKRLISMGLLYGGSNSNTVHPNQRQPTGINTNNLAPQ